MKKITIKNLKISYEGKSVLNVNKIVFCEGLNYITGSNGSGKSTLLKFVANVNSNLKINYDLFSLQELKKGIIPMITQNPINSVCKELSFMENLIIYKFSKEKSLFSFVHQKKYEEYIINFLKCNNLFDNTNKILHSSVNTLSGGELQILSIIMRLLKSEEILLLDEPTANLDMMNTKKIMELIMKLVEKKYIIIMVAHDEKLMQAYAGHHIKL